MPQLGRMPRPQTLREKGITRLESGQPRGERASALRGARTEGPPKAVPDTATPAASPSMGAHRKHQGSTMHLQNPDTPCTLSPLESCPVKQASGRALAEKRHPGRRARDARSESTADAALHAPRLPRTGPQASSNPPGRGLSCCTLRRHRFSAAALLAVTHDNKAWVLDSCGWFHI